MKKLLVVMLLAFSVSAQATDFIITIPDGSAPRVADAIAETHDYMRNRLTISPGVFETKASFAKRMLVRWLKEQVILAEQGPAKAAAENQIRTSVESIAVTTN